MPPPPLIQSDRLRNAVVAVVMLLAFLGSVGLAALFSHSRSMTPSPFQKAVRQVGDLAVALPASWTPVEDAGAGSALSLLDQAFADWPGPKARLQDPQRPSRQLLAAPLPGLAPRSPVRALDEALVRLISVENIGYFNAVSREPLRVGSLAGTTFIAIGQLPVAVSQPGAGGSGPAMVMVAVVTEDARRYWVVCLKDVLTPPGMIGQLFRENGQLFQAICQSLASQRHRDAVAADAREAGVDQWPLLKLPDVAPASGPASGASDLGPGPVWSAPPDAQLSADQVVTPEEQAAATPNRPAPAIAEQLKLRPAAPYQSEPGAPLLLLPTDAVGQLWFLRIRGAPDTTWIDPAHPLGPPQQFKAAYDLIHETNTPVTSVVQRQSLAETFVWRGVMAMATAKSLGRQIWLAKPPGGRAAMIELVYAASAESEAVMRAQRLVQHLVLPAKSADTPGDPASPGQSASDDAGIAKTPPQTPQQGFDGALAKGRTIANWQREQLDRFMLPQPSDLLTRGSGPRLSGAGESYWLIRESGLVVGYQVESRRTWTPESDSPRGDDADEPAGEPAPPADTDPAPPAASDAAAKPGQGNADPADNPNDTQDLDKIAGAAMLFKGALRTTWAPRGELVGRSRLTWTADVACDRFRLKSRHEKIRPGQAPVVTGFELREEDRRLTQSAVGRVDRAARWDMPSPQALIPPMTEAYWPVDLLGRSEDEAALVWLTAGDRQPMAFWAWLADDAAAAGVLAQTKASAPPELGLDPAYVLLLRPMMGLDVNRLVLTGQGHVAGQVWHDAKHGGAGPMRFEVLLTTWDDVAEQFPEAAEAWE